MTGGEEAREGGSGSEAGSGLTGDSPMRARTHEP